MARDAPPPALYGPEHPQPAGLEQVEQGQLGVVPLGPLFEAAVEPEVEANQQNRWQIFTTLGGWLMLGATAQGKSLPCHDSTSPLPTRSKRGGQLFGVDVDHVAGALPLVALPRLPRLQIPEPAKPQGVHPSRQCRGRLEGLGDSAESAALVAVIHGLLQLLPIERPPLAAANTPAIRQRGWTT